MTRLRTKTTTNPDQAKGQDIQGVTRPDFVMLQSRSGDIHSDHDQSASSDSDEIADELADEIAEMDENEDETNDTLQKTTHADERPRRSSRSKKNYKDMQSGKTTKENQKQTPDIRQTQNKENENDNKKANLIAQIDQIDKSPNNCLKFYVQQYASLDVILRENMRINVKTRRGRPRW